MSLAHGSPDFASVRKRLLFTPLTLLFLAWIALYIPSLRTVPGWYGDETLTLMIGRSLASGEVADRAMKPTFWHPSYSYQPAYAWAIGVASRITHGDILGARFANTLLALAIAFTLYLGGRQKFGILCAFSAALFFLSYSQTIIHFRWIYPHNAVALGFTITVLALLRRSAGKTDAIAGSGLALATLSHPLFVHGAIAAWLCRICRPVAWIRMAILPTIALALSLAFAIVLYWPKLFVFEDIKTLMTFYADYSSRFGGLGNLRFNFTEFYTYDIFHFSSLAGILICATQRRFYPIAVFVLVVSILLLQNRSNLNLFYYQAIIFLPVLIMAWAGAATTIGRRLRAGKSTLHRLPALLLFGIAILSLGVNGRALWTGQLIPNNQPWVTQDIKEVEQAANWINERITPDDLVIAHQNIGWLLHCKTADFLQTAAWSGLPTFTLEDIPSHDRFRYPADLEAARYVVIGDIDRFWTFDQPHIEDLLIRLQKEKWLAVWHGRNYIVLENPITPP